MDQKNQNVWVNLSQISDLLPDGLKTPNNAQHL
jgi:hypothetical protein